MARGRKRVVEATSESIKTAITTIDTKIESLNEEIKQLRIQKKELSKDLIAAKKKEAEEKEISNMKALASLMKEKNITIEELEKMINQ